MTTQSNFETVTEKTRYAKPMLTAVCGLLAAASLTVLTSTPAHAEWKPKEITIVVPHSLGGGQERLTRAFASVWEKHIGTKLKILPKRGSSGRVGFDYFQTQPTDGTVIVSTNLATSGIMWIQQKPKWDWNKTIQTMGLFGIDPGVYAVRKESKFKTFKEAIEAAKKKPLTVAVTQWSSSENLNVHQVMAEAKTQFQAIAAGGGSKTLTAVLGGHVDMAMTKVSNFKKGADKLRFLAISQSRNMIPGLTNDAPTVDGALDIKTTHVASYRAIVVHKAMKEKYPDRFALLMKTMEAAKDDPAYIKKAQKVGIHPDLIVDMSPDELQKIVEGYWDAFNKYKGIGIFKKKSKKKKEKKESS
ncbi:MAG: tripartite tricarboxylate transporter substrate-binding protein [Rhodospirillales bacterium]